jgi:hypothetical protein
MMTLHLDLTNEETQDLYVALNEVRKKREAQVARGEAMLSAEVREYNVLTKVLRPLRAHLTFLATPVPRS